CMSVSQRSDGVFDESEIDWDHQGQTVRRTDRYANGLEQTPAAGVALFTFFRPKIAFLSPDNCMIF
ncbi:hypothetical protein, partial [Enterobacter cloacae complex sp. 2DZ2F20B]|uniref:hypothetical protein n=1 Tax=Enterobacter cloacae complex sp. 2DZ2F20B TaxID=2511993 RepID=UPI001025812E